jgi:hypothetical protein
MGSTRCRHDTFLKTTVPEDKELADYIADTMDLKPARHSSMIERQQNFKRRLLRRVSLIGAMSFLKGAAQLREESEPDVLGGHLSEECKGVVYPHFCFFRPLSYVAASVFSAWRPFSCLPSPPLARKEGAHSIDCSCRHRSG